MCNSHFSFCYFILGTFRELVDINFVASMGPPGGGRNPVTPRFLRHFNHLSFTELEDESKHRIFATILKSWIGKALYSESKFCFFSTVALLVGGGGSTGI